MRINDEGSVVQFIPENQAEADWLNEKVCSEEWQWFGKSLVVDYRMAEDIFQACIDQGFIGASE